jgi:hypothetical protein
MDEYPIHQSPLSMAYVATSDKNFYDRCYFNAHDRTGDIFLITGLGYYPNLGVMDAYATVRRGGTQWAVRFSDAMGDDRLHQRVGPYTIEVIEPLQKLRLVCDSSDILDASRFAQVGSWSGTLHVGGEDVAVDPDVWLGTRDRSWGIRPVGASESPERFASDEPLEGFWWLYVPVRFDDFAVIVICQELPNGFRTLNDATRVWRDGRIEQLGWPDIDIRYASGTRNPVGATLHLRDAERKPLDIEITTLGSVALHLGAGYGGDPTWNHGRWMGRGWSDAQVYDLTDPAVGSNAPIGVIDHVARASINGAEGWGLFEHGTFGRHDPSGFADWGSVAP